MKAVIPAAGLGSRFLPATKAQPKEMLPVVDKPAIQYIVEEALEAGVDEVIIVNSRDKKSIEDQFSPHDVLVKHLRGVGKDAYADAVEHAGALPVKFVYQDEPLGLGHAVHVAAPETGDDMFFVMLGDVLVPDNAMCQKMRAISEEHGGASVIAVLPLSLIHISKIDIKVKDALGRWWQCSTVQVDFNLPERFDITYRTAENTSERPWMLHRALFGSIERFLGILIEHTSGNLPLWLAPTQAIVIPIADRHAEMAQQVADELRAHGGRIEVYDQNEPMRVKIAKAQGQRVPYMLVIGDKEVENGEVAVRERHEGDLGSMKLEYFANIIEEAQV